MRNNPEIDRTLTQLNLETKKYWGCAFHLYQFTVIVSVCYTVGMKY